MAATDERAIHEFPTGTIDDNSLLIMDRPTATPGEYETEKFAIANLGLKLLGGIDFPNNLDTDEQDIFGAINEVNAKAMNISDEYDETASYSKGDYCIYQNATYRCVKASGTTTGTFVDADWTSIEVLTELKNANTAINGKADSNDVYTKTEVDTALDNKANSADVYTKSQVDTSLSNKQDKLNKGTLGSTVDLDTLFANSVYYLSGATTTQHAPCSYGMLEVISATLTLQRVTKVGTQGTSNSQYERIYINNAWTAWKTITRS